MFRERGGRATESDSAAMHIASLLDSFFQSFSSFLASPSKIKRLLEMLLPSSCEIDLFGWPHVYILARLI